MRRGARKGGPHGHRAKVRGGVNELCTRVRKFVQTSTENDIRGLVPKQPSRFPRPEGIRSRVRQTGQQLELDGLLLSPAQTVEPHRCLHIWVTRAKVTNNDIAQLGAERAISRPLKNGPQF